jgi:hypothetical protein
MQENNMGEVWQDLTIWRKIAISIFFIMWLSFSGEAILALNGNVFATVISLCGLWIVYLLLAYFIAKFGN